MQARVSRDRTATFWLVEPVCTLTLVMFYPLFPETFLLFLFLHRCCSDIVALRPFASPQLSSQMVKTPNHGGRSKDTYAYRQTECHGHLRFTLLWKAHDAGLDEKKAHLKMCAISHFVICFFNGSNFTLDTNYSAVVWPRSVYQPTQSPRPEQVKANRSITTWGLSQPASGQSHLAWRMTLSVHCLILPVQMPPLARAYLPIDRCDLSGSSRRNDNWFNWRWWMKGFYGTWITSWWQSGGWWGKFMGQKAECSCCGFDKSQLEQFIWSMLGFSLEMFLRGSDLSTGDELERCSSSPLEPSERVCINLVRQATDRQFGEKAIYENRLHKYACASMSWGLLFYNINNSYI